jgi:ribosome-binding protein aMBF1 (putative translation factor)
MSRKHIPVEESIARWRQDAAFVEAYEALADEFAFARQVISARSRAGLTQAQLAERMNTTQSVIARLEGGKTRPSTRTLEKLAAATGSKLEINLVPAE